MISLLCMFGIASKFGTDSASKPSDLFVLRGFGKTAALFDFDENWPRSMCDEKGGKISVVVCLVALNKGIFNELSIMLSDFLRFQIASTLHVMQLRNDEPCLTRASSVDFPDKEELSIAI